MEQIILEWLSYVNTLIIAKENIKIKLWGLKNNNNKYNTIYDLSDFEKKLPKFHTFAN